MRLILLGCPGAGKGTQAKYITEKYQIPQISTGEILRNAIQKESELGKKVKSIVDGGQLVPDEIMIQLVKERLQQPDTKNGFLLDGFPRTVAQAEALKQFSDIDYVIDIDVSEDEVVQRLSGRRTHPASGRTYHVIFQPPKVADIDDITGEPLIQRADDSEATVRKRLQIYQEQTRPLRAYYQNFTSNTGGIVPFYIRIEGLGTVEQIKDHIYAALNTHKEAM